MSIIEILLVGIGLSMDAFAVSVCKGLSLGRIRAKHVLIAGVWFGGFQALMPIAGFYLGGLFLEYIVEFDHWVAFALLAFIGGEMIKGSFDNEEERNASMGVKEMFLLAIATSIDALAVGISLACLNVNIWISASVIGITTFVLSAIGVLMGSFFGARYQKKAKLLGGIVLVGIGIKILLEGLGII